MKYWYITAAVLVTAAAVGLALSRKKPPDHADEIEGGVRHYVDESLPKEIRSTEITYFFCRFSALDRPLEDTTVAGQIFTLTASRESGICQVRNRSKDTISETFQPDAAFFDRLQDIVSRYEMAQNNGQHYSVSGLPPEFGIELEVRYASGERIHTSNNQSCFLSNAAMEELAALFIQK